MTEPVLGAAVPASTRAEDPRIVDPMRSARSAWVLCCLGGCADEGLVTGGAEFEPRCEEDAPTRLLELAADELVYMVRPLDDTRIHVRIGTEDAWTHSVLVSTCGEEVQPIASRIEWLFIEGDVLLGCDVDDALVAPSDPRDDAPSVIAEGGCAYQQTPHGVVTIDRAPGADVGRIIVVRDDDGVVVVETLLDDVLMEHGVPYFTGVEDDQVFARRSDASLWVVDVATGTSTRVLDPVLDWARSTDHLVYRPVDDTPDDGESAVIVRDRATGSEATIAEAADDDLSLMIFDGAVVLGHLFSTQAQWFWASDGRPVEPPAGARIHMRYGDRFWIGSGTSAGDTYAWWRAGEAPVAAWTCPSCEVTPRADLGGLVVEDILGGTRREVWFIDEATGAQERLGGPIRAGYLVLDDRRLLGLADGDGPGPLELHTPGESSPQTVAQWVEPDSPWLTQVFRGPSNLDVVYVVNEPDDGEHALYVGRLASAD